MFKVAKFGKWRNGCQSYQIRHSSYPLHRPPKVSSILSTDCPPRGLFCPDPGKRGVPRSFRQAELWWTKVTDIRSTWNHESVDFLVLKLKLELLGVLIISIEPRPSTLDVKSSTLPLDPSTSTPRPLDAKLGCPHAPVAYRVSTLDPSTSVSQNP